MKCSIALIASLASALALATTANLLAAPVNSLFDPNDGAALMPDFNPVANVAYNPELGTLSDGTTTWTATLESNASGNVKFHVFRFDSVNVGSGITISPSTLNPATQKPGIVIASRGDLDFSGTLDFSGKGNNNNGGRGGPGAEGGTAEVLDGNLGNNSGSFNSAPPPANAGNAQPDGVNNARGFGGGQQASASGSGGGYGGRGGDGSGAEIGGATYGDDVLTDLYGGSAGASATSNGEGGGGGGAVELIASETLTFDGNLNAFGGEGDDEFFDGAGGSGGGVILAADEIVLLAGAMVDASGGDAAEGTETTDGRSFAGGGGGGRVAFYANTITASFPIPSFVSIDGGSGSGPNNDGALGSFRFAGDSGQGDLSFPFQTQAVPEPASLAVWLLLGLVGVGVALGYRRRFHRSV